MASRGAHPDGSSHRGGLDFAARALGSRRRLRLLAVALWSSFLGAAVTVLVAVTVIPGDAAEAFTLGDLSLLFFAAWALALLPVSLALFLASPPGELPPLDRHGR